LLIGKAIGLRNAVLQDLGLAALLHDVGYASLPPEIAAGPEGLQRHPVEGARQLLRQHGFHEAKLRRLRAVLDHHRDHADPRSQPSLLGEILHLAEDYTTLQRLWKARISPADALGAIARTSEEIYHPALVQLMVNALGRYPPGTLLELADGRMGRSVSPVRSPETFAQPIVRLLVPGTSAPADERVDLALGGSVRRVLPG
jgi:HD-GYP domain-containing protein (c-di-GMP phosphodiesterase class II)